MWREFVLAHTFRELTFPEDLPHCLELTRQLAARQIPRYCVEKRFVRADESVVGTRITVTAARKEDGAVDYFIGAAEDITEHQEAQDSGSRS